MFYRNKYFKPLFFLSCFFLLAVPAALGAQSDGPAVAVQPQVIDAKAKAKDVLEYQIKLVNNGENKASLYAIVADLPADGAPIKIADRYDLSKATSLARWLNIKRSETQINAGDEIVLPLKIEVNLSARPGKYYAIVVFAQGSYQADAAAKALATNQPRLLINLEVEEEIVEKIQLVKFGADRRIYYSSPVNFTVELKNIGNRDLAPAGSVRIYDRRGQETANLAINENSAIIPPDTAVFYLPKLDSDIRLGRYKAKLSLEYGSKNKRDIIEFSEFWILPLKLALAVLVGLFGCLVALIVIMAKIARSNRGREDPRDGIINLRT